MTLPELDPETILIEEAAKILAKYLNDHEWEFSQYEDMVLLDEALVAETDSGSLYFFRSDPA